MESMTLRATSLVDLVMQVQKRLVKSCDKHPTEASRHLIIEYLSNECPICRMERNERLQRFNEEFGEMTAEEFLKAQGL